MEVCKCIGESKEINILINNLRSKIEEESKTRTNGSYKKFLFYLKDKKFFYGGCYGIIIRKNLHIRLLWVAKNNRRNKYGSQLIRLTEELARKEGCSFITVNTIYNEIADRFYKKLGYFLEHSKIDKRNREIYEKHYRKDL